MNDSEPTIAASAGTDSPPGDPRTRSLSHRRSPTPTWIGTYKIQSILGEGGMGTVYLATQSKPIHRKVALKVIKPGMDSQVVLARFDAERQALALMDHPGIARMLDAGTTPEGRPFFVMEYVAGIPLDIYCDTKKLDLDQRLRLFIDVCQAVLHAHQKAVLHRDLKPSNILVAEVNGKPAPKIIDFGLAKALGQSLTDQSLFTQQGILVGTPDYMSPEQVEASAHPADTRTDVYSLGVILFRLVTGSLPFSTRAIREASPVGAIHALQSLICDTDPPRPSTRVTSSHELGDALAKVMRTQTSTLVRKLRGDLDWIVLKSLEKDRNRRYSTAAELADDIRRHLDDEAVHARPPSTAYRLRKLARRNAGAVLSVGALFVLLVAGVVTSTAFYLRAEEKRVDAEEARSDADLQKNEAILARERESGERVKAEDARKAALEAQRGAERHRDEVLRLSDVKRLDQLRARADDLWPAHPANVPAMTDWLAEARLLAGNLEGHRAFLNELRTRAVSGPSSSHATPDRDPDSEAAKGAERATRDSVGTWVFSDTVTQWQHDVLEELVTGLETFTGPDPRIGTIADVERRLAFAGIVREKSLEMYSVEWEQAIASIRDDCPQYRGLEITPQIGLIPLSRDPRSGLWEFAHLQTGEIPFRDEDGELVIDQRTGIVFVLIPGVTFTMGAQKNHPDRPNYDPQADANERPVHEVTLSPYFLSKYEMTQGQWEGFTGENPSYYQNALLGPKPGLHPVEQVSWEDSQRVMGRLGLVLPTEAQWEYAARAGTTTPWSTGSERESLDGAANLADACCKENGGQTGWVYEEWLDDGFTVHGPVGSLSANGFGLHDVHGNVFEWCRDCSGDYSSPVAPGDGERRVSSRLRVSRGGSFIFTATSARSAFRNGDPPEGRYNFLGLRPARAIE